MRLKQITPAERGWNVVFVTEGEITFNAIVAWGLFVDGDGHPEEKVFAMYHDGTPELSVYDAETLNGPLAIAAPGEDGDPKLRAAWLYWDKQRNGEIIEIVGDSEASTTPPEVP